ncbi:MAG: class I SAM-dependent methyltransferase, partial [Anaerolineae bacterium]|nr:class I SAM-dependent methyltransferase [Anaerolineae bacterium]
ARGLQRRLSEVDERLLRSLRARVRAGELTGSALRAEFGRYTSYRRTPHGAAHLGYDGLDVLVQGLLLADPAPKESGIRSPEMVQYEATPARAVLDMIDRAPIGGQDVFYDLGAGLGHVALMVGLLTGATVRGVEIEPAFCAYAERQAARLAVENVRCLCGDARDLDYGDGTVFYLFTPFRGSVLDAVLDRLRVGAGGRSIRVCTYGSCTIRVAREGWLRSLDGNADHEFKVAIYGPVDER